MITMATTSKVNDTVYACVSIDCHRAVTCCAASSVRRDSLLTSRASVWFFPSCAAFTTNAYDRSCLAVFQDEPAGIVHAMLRSDGNAAMFVAVANLLNTDFIKFPQN